MTYVYVKIQTNSSACTISTKRGNRNFYMISLALYTDKYYKTVNVLLT
jgi:hypothetical protein